MKWKRLQCIGLAIGILFGNTLMAHAAWKTGEEPNQDKWQYEFEDGTYAANGWYWLDGNKDDIEECYYFDENGWMLSNTRTPDGYQVDASGAWVSHGVMQTRNIYEPELLASGLIKQKDGWGFRNNDGSLARDDWKTINGKKYYFDASACAVKGWHVIDGYKYYFNEHTYDLVQNLEGIFLAQSYWIAVDRVRCQVTVYASDGENGYIVPYRTFICSPGTENKPTPLGNFPVTRKYRWHALVESTYGQYCTRFGNTDILFHSVPGRSPSVYNIPAAEFNKLGEPASHGCIRMTVADAKWIYDNCGYGTLITVGDELPAPFDRPEIEKIPEGQNWDPTDPAIH